MRFPYWSPKGYSGPLATQPANGVKYFATATLVELHRDVKWLSRASEVVVEYWRYKNARKTIVAGVDGR